MFMIMIKFHAFLRLQNSMIPYDVNAKTTLFSRYLLIVSIADLENVEIISISETFDEVDEPFFRRIILQRQFVLQAVQHGWSVLLHKRVEGRVLFRQKFLQQLRSV